MRLTDKMIYEDLKAMLTANYEVPSAVTEATKDLLVFRKTGNFANPSWYARCECVASGGFHVDVGRFDEDGLDVDGLWRDLSDYTVGLAASRLPTGRQEHLVSKVFVSTFETAVGQSGSGKSKP